MTFEEQVPSRALIENPMRAPMSVPASSCVR